MYNTIYIISKENRKFNKMRVTPEMNIKELKKDNYIIKQGVDEHGQPRLYTSTMHKDKMYTKKTGIRKLNTFTEPTLKKTETRKMLNTTMKHIRKSLGDRVTEGKIDDDDIAFLHDFINSFNPVKLREYLNLKLSSKL